MKPQHVVGIVLVAPGLVALTDQGITCKSREKAIDTGPPQLTAKNTHAVPLPPVPGAIALAGGIRANAGGKS